MKLSRKTLQNLQYFWNKKTQILFSFSFLQQLWICNSRCPEVYVNIELEWVIEQEIHCYKSNVARNEKQQKDIGFSYSKNVANFEAFCETISSSIGKPFISEE